MERQVKLQPLKNRPSFFKVLIGDFSKQLYVPRAFIKHFHEKSILKSIIRSSTGRCWSVNLEEDETGFFFRNGWQDFVKAHNLEFGDFLVFKYCGKSEFRVRIYGKNACEKNIILTTSNKDDSSCFNPNKVKQKQAGIKFAEHHRPQNPKKTQKQIPIVPHKRTSKRLVSGRTAVIKTDAASLGVGGLAIQPNHCNYIIDWNEHKLHRMPIPTILAKEKGLAGKRTEAVLQDPTGRSWPVAISQRGDGRVDFTRGFANFSRGNKIKLGDVLGFEFLTDSLVQVHIFRAGSREVVEV